MDKRTVRLTESELKEIITESVKKIINEIKVVDKIPNFDRNRSYDKYNDEWMDYSDAMNLRWKDIKRKNAAMEAEEAEKSRRHKELIEPYLPLLNELEKLGGYLEDVKTYEDENGNIYVANNYNSLEKLRQATVGMSYIEKLLLGDKSTVERGYNKACEALMELGDEEVNKPKIYKLLRQVKILLDNN